MQHDYAAALGLGRREHPPTQKGAVSRVDLDGSGRIDVRSSSMQARNMNGCLGEHNAASQAQQTASPDASGRPWNPPHALSITTPETGGKFTGESTMEDQPRERCSPRPRLPALTRFLWTAAPCLLQWISPTKHTAS